MSRIFEAVVIVTVAMATMEITRYRFIVLVLPGYPLKKRKIANQSKKDVIIFIWQSGSGPSKRRIAYSMTI